MKTLLRASLFTLVAVACVPCAYGRGRASGYCQEGGQTIQVLGYVSSAATPVQRSYTGSGCNVLVLYSNGGGVTATGPSGIINTSSSGNTITWLSGNVFNANGQWAGLNITIVSTTYTISSCSSQTTCTLTSSPGNQTSVAYSMSAATPAAIFSDNAGTGKSNPFNVSSTGYWFYYADNGSYANQYSGAAISPTYTNAALPLSDPSNLPNAVRWNPTLGTTFAQQCAAATAAPNTAIVVDSAAPVATGFTGACSVIFYPNGVIKPASGQTVTLTVQAAGMTQLCDISTGGQCNFVSPNGSVYPKWWGAAGDGSTNDTAPVAAAHTSACATSSKRVVFPPHFTFGIAAVNPANPILPSCSSLTIDIEGTLQIMASSGSYYSIWGTVNSPVSNVSLVGHGTIDQNSGNNPLVSSGDLATYPRIVFHTGTTGSPGNNNVVDGLHFTNVRCLWLLYFGSTNSRATHNIIDGVGGGSVTSDSSLIFAYNTATSFNGSDNQITATAPNTKMAVTAFETHAAASAISNNIILNMSSGINLVGDAAAITSGEAASGNVISGVLSCITLWSQNTLGNPTYGLSGADVSGNTCIVNQAQYTSTGFPGNGITISALSTLNSANIKVNNNLITFDLSASSSDPYNNVAGFGVGYYDGSMSANMGCYDCDFSGNTVVNAPTAGAYYLADGSNVSFDNETITNPGSSLNPGLISAYRAGIFLGGQTAPVGGVISVKGGTISDTLGTSRMAYGVEVSGVNINGIAIDGPTVSVSDPVASSLQYAISTNGGGQLPFVRASVSVPSGAVIGGTYTSGGSIAGTIGQTCIVDFIGGTYLGNATVALTGSNTIAGGTALVIVNGGSNYSGTPPSSATLASGTATCSGTAVVSTTLNVDKVTPAANVALSSAIYSMPEALTYTFNGLAWTPNIPHPGQPVVNPSHSGSCGTSPTIAGNDRGGSIIIGSGTVTTCYLTFSRPFLVAPFGSGGSVNLSTNVGSPTFTEFDTQVGGFDFVGTNLAGNIFYWSFPNAQ